MVGRANYLLKRMTDAPRAHADLVPAGSADYRHLALCDSNFERTLLTLYSEGCFGSKRIAGENRAIAPYDDRGGK
jgi:hypothetical protein